jgi:hypothetical protein
MKILIPSFPATPLSCEWLRVAQPSRGRTRPPVCRGVAVSLACDSPQSPARSGPVLLVRIRGDSTTVGFQMFASEIFGIEPGEYHRMRGETRDLHDNRR